MLSLRGTLLYTTTTYTVPSSVPGGLFSSTGLGLRPGYHPMDKLKPMYTYYILKGVGIGLGTLRSSSSESKTRYPYRDST